MQSFKMPDMAKQKPVAYIAKLNLMKSLTQFVELLEENGNGMSAIPFHGTYENALEIPIKKRNEVRDQVNHLLADQSLR